MAAVYSAPPRRKLRVIAQDPTILTSGNKVLMTEVEVPAEDLVDGPRGHRVQVIDFDSSTQEYFAPGPPLTKTGEDRYGNGKEFTAAQLLRDRNFHAQNVYAIVSSTLLTFETALGRHISWGFEQRTHQIKIAPHAFCDANAFYSRRDEGLLFGYFASATGDGTVFTCLSHDVIVHEATHAILDGLRRQYARPSSADQAAFHEGFADIVALLSVFRSEDIVAHGLRHTKPDLKGTLSLGDLEAAIHVSFLTGLAEEMGRKMDQLNRSALRRSLELEDEGFKYKEGSDDEEHALGELLVAAVMRAFLHIWWRRLLGKMSLDPAARTLTPAQRKRRVEPWRVIEEGSKTAKHLLNMLIRAIDYMPPVDMKFGDFLNAVMTADTEACPDDSGYGYRQTIQAAFKERGILPQFKGNGGNWAKPAGTYIYGHAHFEPMRWDREAIFRFIWENRGLHQFNLSKDAFTMVESVRPVVRIAADGFVLREVVVEYFQLMTLKASELGLIGKLKKPEGMPNDREVQLCAGGTLIFDEFGQLKYDIGNRLDSPKQNERLKQMWRRGFFSGDGEGERRFANIHAQRALRSTEPTVVLRTQDLKAKRKVR